MIKLKILGKEIISWGQPKPENITLKPSPLPVNLPAKRTSKPSHQEGFSFDEKSEVIQPDFLLEVIPVIRKLSYTNPNISQALNNLVELGNTGHSIKFDASVSEADINKMRQHLDSKKREWSESLGGMDGLINKMISQVAISGALSNEWVPNISLTGIKTVVMVNPELIRWVYNKSKEVYEPYQYDSTKLTTDKNQLIKLNTNTFKYYALNGDTDKPYGIPPYLPALDPTRTQKLMLDNIKFIVEQVGVLGFLNVMMEKPEQLTNESDKNYQTRLNTFLDDARKRVQEGYRDGVAVGYKGDTEFDFKSTSKNFTGVNELYILNDLLQASGLKMDASMLGKNYGTSETQISVIFTKLLSQLKNIQNLIKSNLEYGYSLELRLAGFKFNTLNVIFNPSTALDALKYEQAEEIKIRNNNALYLDGIISQEQYAHNMGYETADKPKPRFLRTNVQSEAEAKEKREKGKDVSDKKVREKNKPQPKIK